MSTAGNKTEDGTSTTSPAKRSTSEFLSSPVVKNVLPFVSDDSILSSLTRVTDGTRLLEAVPAWWQQHAFNPSTS